MLPIKMVHHKIRITTLLLKLCCVIPLKIFAVFIVMALWCDVLSAPLSFMFVLNVTSLSPLFFGNSFSQILNVLVAISPPSLCIWCSLGQADI